MNLNARSLIRGRPLWARKRSPPVASYKRRARLPESCHSRAPAYAPELTSVAGLFGIRTTTAATHQLLRKSSVNGNSLLPGTLILDGGGEARQAAALGLKRIDREVVVAQAAGVGDVVQLRSDL